MNSLVLGFWRMLDWQRSTKEHIDFIEQCLALGLVDIDHADIYGQYQCESAFGELLKQRPDLAKQLRITTKCGIVLPQARNSQSTEVNHYNSSASHIIASAQQSLKNLHVEQLHCLLIHRPDYLMNADEVARAFNQLHAQGDVAHFGVSNFTPSQVALLQSRLDFKLFTNQVEFSAYENRVLDDGTLDQCQQLAIRPMCWSPLAGGKLLTGTDNKSRRLQSALAQVADDIGAQGIDQVALAWLWAHPSNPSVVLGTGHIERVKQAVQAQTLRLSRQQWYAIWEASRGHAVP